MNKNRLTRLERIFHNEQQQAEAGLPPRFWDALGGHVPPEEMHPETRRLIDSLRVSGRTLPDPIEARLRAAEAALRK